MKTNIFEELISVFLVDVIVRIIYFFVGFSFIYSIIVSTYSSLTTGDILACFVPGLLLALIGPALYHYETLQNHGTLKKIKKGVKALTRNRSSVIFSADPNEFFSGHKGNS